MLATSAMAILFFWVVIAVVLIGIGCISLRLFGQEFFLTDAFWMGLAVSTVLLQVWHFFLPIDSSVTILLGCVGLIGLISNRSRALSGLRRIRRDSFAIISLYLAITFLTALRAGGPCDYYDTGLYGAQAVRWILNFPVVPGLANVHGRLGFNSSVFLWVAAFSHGLWKAYAYHLLTGLMIAAMWATLLPAIFRLVRTSSVSPADWFYCILAIPLSFWTFRTKIVGTLTDEPSAITCWIAAGIIFEELANNNAEEDRVGNLRLLTATALLALSVSFKESTIIFALFSWILAFHRIWTKTQRVKERRNYAGGAFAVSTAILLPWCLHGVVLSGYPFFPATMLGLPVDWKVPVAVARWYAAAVRSFGRIPEVPIARTQGMGWLGGWLSRSVRDRASFQVPVGISLGGLAVALSLRIRHEERPACPWLWFLLPSVSGIVFWFIAAPGLRFAQFAFWTAAGTLGAWGAVSVASKFKQDFRSAFLMAIAAAMIWTLFSFGWKAPYSTLLKTKSLPAMPQANTNMKRTSSGLAVYMPDEGNQCWEAALPCTPYFDETLRLRSEQSMSSGFQSELQARNLVRFEK